MIDGLPKELQLCPPLVRITMTFFSLAIASTYQQPRPSLYIVRRQTSRYNIVTFASLPVC